MNSYTAYTIGVLAGLEVRAVGTDSALLVNQPTDEILLLLGGLVNQTAFGNTLRLPYSNYRNGVNNTLDSPDNLVRRQFTAGYIQSAGKWDSGTLSVIVRTSEFSNKVSYLLSEVATPSESFSIDCGVAYVYRAVAALDMLNCVSLYGNESGMYTGLHGDDKEAARWDLNLGFKSPYSSRTPAMLYTKLRPDAVVPSKARASDAGYDLTVTHVAKALSDNVALYGTGLAIEPPFGYYFDLVPRSSISKTGYMLANSTGIIDPTYRGEVLVALRRVDSAATDLELPLRVAQLIPRPIIHFDVIEVELSETTRNDGGFGSTGK